MAAAVPVWPIYLVTMHLAALWIIVTLHLGNTPSPDAEKLTAMSYIRQLLMVQLWFEPFFDGTSWDGPAWSISAEWLAYLCFARWRSRCSGSPGYRARERCWAGRRRRAASHDAAAR